MRTGVVRAVVAVPTVVAACVVRRSWSRWSSRFRRSGRCGLSYSGEGAQRGRKRKHELFHLRK